MSTTLDTFSTPHMIDHEFNDYEFSSNAILFQNADNIDINQLDIEAEEEASYSSEEDDLSFNQEEIESDKAISSFETKEALNNPENIETETNDPSSTIYPSSEADNLTTNHGEYAGELVKEEDDHKVNIEDEEQEDDDNENSITPILLTYCSKKYCIFTDEINPDTIQGSQSIEHVIFPNQQELYSQSLKSFMQSIQSQFKIINDIVIFFPTLKLKFYSHIPFAEKLSLRDVAFLASNVNPQSNILEIELTEEPYNFVSQYQLLINITREELSDEENTNSPKYEQEQETEQLEEELSEESNLGKRHRTQNIELEENDAKRQKL